MTGTVQVSFEYESRPVQTVRSGPWKATKAETILKRGFRDALQQAESGHWSSVVVVMEKT